MEVQPAPVVRSQVKTAFQEEVVTLALCEEMLPLLVQHYMEIAHYPDIQLKVNFDAYVKLYESGCLKVYTARQDGVLVGYGVYVVRPNPKYSDSLQAVQDVLYIDPKKRGMGGRFILWCDEELRKLGVQVVYQHVKLAHDFGPLLERFGYEAIETIWGRRLDHGG